MLDSLPLKGFYPSEAFPKEEIGLLSPARLNDDTGADPFENIDDFLSSSFFSELPNNPPLSAPPKGLANDFEFDDPNIGPPVAEEFPPNKFVFCPGALSSFLSLPVPLLNKLFPNRLLILLELIII